VLILEGLILGVLIGTVLGVVGAGGAILAVPGLVAVMGLSATSATTSSMVVVGTAALSGALRRVKSKNLDIKTGITFSLLGFLGTLLGSQIVRFFSDRVLLLLFALLMIVAVVGLLTGLLGVGGGFLIVPALVLILGVKVKLAAGTSLVAIAMNSAIAFLLRFHYWHTVPWTSVLVFAGAAVIASFVTTPLATKLPAKALQKAFSVLVVLVAIYMVVSQIFK